MCMREQYFVFFDVFKKNKYSTLFLETFLGENTFSSSNLKIKTNV